MKVTTAVLSLAAIAATGVKANIWSISIPTVIQPNVPFDAPIEVPIQQPHQWSILWGSFPYSNETTAPYLPKIGELGFILGQTDLTKSLTGQYYDSIKSLVVNNATYSGDTTVYIQAIILESTGVLEQVGAESFFIGPITIGDHTSTDFVKVQVGDTNWKRWTLS